MKKEGQNKKHSLRLGLTSIVLILLSNCANEVAPTGGKKDTEAPKLVASYPANESRNFHAKKMLFKFDEYLNYALNVSQIQVTPVLNPVPKFFVNGKKITVILPKTLDSNTTYNFMFGETIKDINEGNTIRDFSFCFSTGDSLDVCLIKGTSLSLYDMKPVESVMVGLYDENPDFGKAPLYYTNTDKSGAFGFRNIKRGKYTVVGFDDKNRNRIFDRGDGIVGFLNLPINIQDTITDLKLNLFPSPQGKIIQSIVPRGNKIDITFTHPIDNINIYAEPKNSLEFAALNETRDSLVYWFKNESSDSITFSFVINDSTTIFKTKNHYINDSLYFLSQKNTSTIASSSSYLIKLNNPISNINSNLITIIEDSIKKIESKLITVATKENYAILRFPKKMGSNYTLLLEDSCIKDIFENFTKKQTIILSCTKELETGNLILKRSSTDSSYLIIELKNEKGELISKKHFSPLQPVAKIEGLQAGGYSIIGIEDANKNGYWDSGNFELKIQPEKKVILKSLITIKSGWDIEAEINSKNSTEQLPSSKNIMNVKNKN